MRKIFLVTYCGFDLHEVIYSNGIFNDYDEDKTFRRSILECVIHGSLSL